MPLVIVERSFDTPQTFAELQCKEDRISWCLETHRVRFVRSLFARDGRRVVCMYEAPDVEAVRTTQRTADLPVEHIWSATSVIDAIGSVHAADGVAAIDAPSGYVLAVVQRALPAGVTLEHVQHLATDPTGCGRRMRLVHVGAFLALDCSRMVCMYYAPDLESVRVANREMGIPIETLWNGELMRASG